MRSKKTQKRNNPDQPTNLSIESNHIPFVLLFYGIFLVVR